MFIPIPTLQRLPVYYNIFLNAQAQGREYLSSTEIAEILGVDSTQVRKDISFSGYVGKPKSGFEVNGFITHLNSFFDLKKKKKAVLVGVGNLGLAIARYSRFKEYGLEIMGMFDVDLNKIGLKVGENPILPINEMSKFITEMGIQIAIITVPKEVAQEVATALIDFGIKAIWNFAPIHLKLPQEITVLNQDLTADFLTLSMHMMKEELKNKADRPAVPANKDDLYLCMGSACHQRGSYHVLCKLKELLVAYDVADRIELKGAFCLGHCAEGIVLKFRGELITHVSKDNIEERFVKEILPLVR